MIAGGSLIPRSLLWGRAGGGAQVDLLQSGQIRAMANRALFGEDRPALRHLCPAVACGSLRHGSRRCGFAHAIDCVRQRHLAGCVVVDDLAVAKAVGDYAAAVRARKIRGLLVACLSDHYRQVLGPVLTFRKRAAVYGCPGIYRGSSLVIFHAAHSCVLATRNELLLGS